MYRELGDRSGEADAVNSFGEVLLATGQPDQPMPNMPPRSAWPLRPATSTSRPARATASAGHAAQAETPISHAVTGSKLSHCSLSSAHPRPNGSGRSSLRPNTAASRIRIRPGRGERGYDRE